MTVAGENTLTTDWPRYAVIKTNFDDCSTSSKRMSGIRKFRQMYGGPECLFSLQGISPRAIQTSLEKQLKGGPYQNF